MKPLASLGIGLLVGLVFTGCSKPPEPTPEKSDKPASSATIPAVSAAKAMGSVAEPSAAAGPADVAWDAPAAWQSAPNPSTMRKATYKIPKAAGDDEDAELTVSSAAGGVDANIKRWETQFGQAKAKVEPRSPNGLKVSVVEIKGTFAGGGMMGGPSTPKNNQMLLGAVVDAGDKQHFFKMVGPEKTVSAARKDFEALVASLRAK